MTPERTDDFREQLSAWHDGALPVEAARFILPRLAEDASLSAALGRWLAFGDALRGQQQAPVREGFAARVAEAIEAADAAVAAPSIAALRGSQRRRGWLAACAAALGTLAVFTWPAADAPPDAAPVAVAAALSLPRPPPPLAADVAVPLALPTRIELWPERIAPEVPALVRAPQPSAEQLAPLPAAEAPSRPWPRSPLGPQPFVVDYQPASGVSEGP